MKYIKVWKDNGDEEEITKQEFLKLLKIHYKDAEEMFNENTRLFPDMVYDCGFSYIKVSKT